MRKAFISTSGCAVLHTEGQAYTDYLKLNGWEITAYPSKADLILLNLCCLNQRRKQDHLEYIGRIKKIYSKRAKITVIGCLSTIAAEEVEKVGVDARITLDNSAALSGSIGADKSFPGSQVRCTVKINPFLIQLGVLLRNGLFGKALRVCLHPASFFGILYHLNMPIEHDLSGSACVTIMSGCSESCSYCAIRFARGRPKSVPSDVLIDVVLQASRQGCRKVHLLGTNPSQYGIDIKGEFEYARLISRLLEIPASFDLVLPDVNPDYFVRRFDMMKEIVKSGRILEITFTLQSGSDTVLSRMKRYYDIRRFKEYMREMRLLDRRLKINSHIIVGFPGETSNEFRETFGLLREMDFDKVMLFEYGDLMATESSRLPGHVSGAEIKRRMDILNRYLLFSFLSRRLFRGGFSLQQPKKQV